jgi:hypothetical protein
MKIFEFFRAILPKLTFPTQPQNFLMKSPNHIKNFSEKMLAIYFLTNFGIKKT